MASDGNTNIVTTTVNDDGNRAPRLPRWTRQEILVLIQGKRVAENRVRRVRAIGGSSQVEPKWASVSSYCKRHGVNRGPVQCRKRWSNLAGDFKKIKEWESTKSGESESFWVMRNDLRRERKLPGFFDREVYDILDGASEVTVTVAVTAEEKLKETDEEFSDFEQSEEGEGDDLDKGTVAAASPKTTVPSPLLISDGNTNIVTTTVNDDGNRAPRLPRWTRQEILVLIQGKRVAENRVRRVRAIGGSSQVEPKWASVSSYCKRHGVNRGPVQCRKRWSNLAGDFKKIKEWESTKSGESESFWVMRNDLRRERKLPGFFDREVYDILDGASEVTVTVAVTAEEKLKETDEEFSDFEQSEEGEGDDLDKGTVAAASPKTTVPSPLLISEKQHQPSSQRYPEREVTTNERQNASKAEKGSPSQEGRKRKRSPSQEENIHTQDQLINVLERNGKMLTNHLEAQNLNCKMDRDQRKDQTNSLVSVLSKLADALGRIADKL